MSSLLDALIETATSLYDMVKSAFSEEDLIPLQERQKQIISELVALDTLLKKSPVMENDRALKKEIAQKFITFEHVNNEFITHVESRFRMIQKRELHPDVLKDLQRQLLD